MTATAGNGTDGLPPHADSPLPIARLVVQANAPTDGGGSRVRLWEDRAYVSTLSAEAGVSIFDVSDPLDPVFLGAVQGIAPHEGIEVLDYGARTVLAMSGSGAIEFVEVTDPAT